MTANEKRELLVTKALTREKKNKYSQDVTKRTLIESGWGDCSGTVWYWYKKLLGTNIGANTEAQIKSKLGKRVDLKITNGVPEESKMRKGDLLYFRGTNNARTEGVGHVEMYIGDGKIFGHGSGLGGTVKDMKSYCRQRQAQRSTTKLKNKGLICVIRFLNDLEELTEINDIVWELATRKVITDSDLWLKLASDDKDIYWLIRKSVHYIREKEEKGCCKSVKVKELEKNSDNVWELQHRGIVENEQLWNEKGNNDVNVCCLLRKIVYFIRKKDI